MSSGRSTTTKTADDNDSEDDTIGCDGGLKCPSRPYVDVDQSKWYHESVDFVIVEELMLGKGELVFDPDGITTRAATAIPANRIKKSRRGPDLACRGFKFFGD